ncbi:MAG: 2-oxo acid dehydrogenase subunit E2 [Lachnospiraceae bacterium]|jgi:pyruvate dehydrogenase E2 component (dihydrolipoamide acetyltransferase)|nr:2-oxo acid dehydrogenase subunit E2 [Lachnospiraceae bacterium]
MAETVLMPKSGISVESCIIGNWKKKVGDEVKIGDILFDYETDKASFECESTAEGVLLEIFFGDGDEVEVLKPVCAVGAAGEDVKALNPTSAGTISVSETSTSDEEATKTDLNASESENTATCEATSGKKEESSAKASPKAKNLAEKLGVNIADATGTGPEGRVIARDVETLAKAAFDSKYEAATKSTDIATSGAVLGKSSEVSEKETDLGEAYTDEKLTKIRSVIASAMINSLQSAAQLTNHHSFDASAILAYRKLLKAGDENYSGISLGDMVLFAVSRTLPDFPYLNALLIDEGKVIRTYKNVNLGVAVDTPRGLMVPTVFDANLKSLKEISDEVKALASACRAGNISPDLLQGGTFTVSNLGTTGVEVFTPILNPPQVGILGVAGVVNRVREGANGIEVYPAMGLSLTYDHRAVDGAPASRFAQALAKNLEQFTLILAGK